MKGQIARRDDFFGVESSVLAQNDLFLSKSYLMMNTTAPSVLQQFPLSPNLGQVGSGFFLGTRTEQQQQVREEATPEQQQQEEVACGERGSSSRQRHQEERHQFTNDPFRIPAEDASRPDTRRANCIVAVVIWAPLFLSMILPPWRASLRKKSYFCKVIL